MDLKAAFRKVMIANECGGNPEIAYRLSDASSGSGLSFGITQLDAGHNGEAVKCLEQCGFLASEIDEIVAKDCDRKAFDSRLAAHSAVIDRFDDAQIADCLNHVFTVARSRRFEYADDAAVLHAADYHNQFFMATDGKFARYCIKLGRPVTVHDIIEFKLDTHWGVIRPDDVRRRHDNIEVICKEQP